MARSGGQYESYTFRELKDMLWECERETRRALNRPFEMQSENRRESGQRWVNNSDMAAEIEWELEFRERDREEREERQVQQEAAREKARTEREEREKQRQAAREKARTERIAKEAAKEASRPTVSLPLDPVERALGAYFGKTDIPEPPELATVRVEVAWTHNRRQYVAFFTGATNTLEVWILVAPGTPGATVINGNEYMPAGDNKLIHQAHVAEAKARKQR